MTCAPSAAKDRGEPSPRREHGRVARHHGATDELAGRIFHQGRHRLLGPFRESLILKSTRYFRHTRQRPDRAGIRDEWILAAIVQPLAEVAQGDGRIRRWAYIPEKARYLRVVLLADGETVHNAVFDRRFQP